MITFPEFLKKYSTIPNQFIDDFFKLFDYKNINSQEKIVNLEDVSKWLNGLKHGQIFLYHIYEHELQQ